MIRADGLPLSVADMLDIRLVRALILHPQAAGIAVLCSFFSLFDTSPRLSGVALSLSILNGILVSTVFAIDVALVTVAKSRVDQGVFVVYWGAGPWMTLAAAICTWTAVGLLVLRTWKYRNNDKTMKVASQCPLFPTVLDR
jgi:uncharacterized membrane protein YedE/YeeE